MKDRRRPHVRSFVVLKVSDIIAHRQLHQQAPPGAFMSVFIYREVYLQLFLGKCTCKLQEEFTGFVLEMNVGDDEDEAILEVTQLAIQRKLDRWRRQIRGPTSDGCFKRCKK